MLLTLSELRECISDVISEIAMTPDDVDVKLGDIFLALINNKWTPVKVTGVKVGADDNGNSDPNRRLYKLKLLGSTRKVGQTRPAMSLRKISSDLKGKTSKFGKKYSGVKAY